MTVSPFNLRSSTMPLLMLITLLGATGVSDASTHGRPAGPMETSTAVSETATPTEDLTATATPTAEPTGTPTPAWFYFPAVVRHWPPLPYPPKLAPIDNPEHDGYYDILWSTSILSEYYRLEESNTIAFTSPSALHVGQDLRYSVAGRPIGTWYYRVQGCNGYGCGDWSETRAATVLPPTPTPTPVPTSVPSSTVHIDNDTGGNLCYEVLGTGIGRKCSSGGSWLYGTFRSGTYSWKVSARCGSMSGQRHFDGSYTHRFWCGFAAGQGLRGNTRQH